MFLARDKDKDLSAESKDKQIKTKNKYGNYPINVAKLELKKLEKSSHGMNQDDIKGTNEVMLAMYRENPVPVVLNVEMVKVLLTEIRAFLDGKPVGHLRKVRRDSKPRKGSILDGVGKTDTINELPMYMSLIWTSIITYDEVPDLFLPQVEELLLKDCNMFKAGVLANARDAGGRKAVDIAMNKTKLAIEDKLLFMGRYKFHQGPPIHKSATSVVVFADDMKATEDYRKTFQKITDDLKDAVLCRGEQFLNSMHDLGIGEERAARSGEERNDELTVTLSLENAMYNGDSLSVSRRCRFLVANTVHVS